MKAEDNLLDDSTPKDDDFLLPNSSSSVVFEKAKDIVRMQDQVPEEQE